MKYTTTKIFIISEMNGILRILTNEVDGYVDPLDKSFTISYKDFRDNKNPILYHISAESEKGESYLHYAVDRLNEMKALGFDAFSKPWHENPYGENE